MPDTQQTLTDEIVRLVKEYRDAVEDACDLGTDDTTQAKLAAMEAIVSRLQEIETELTELRGMKETLVSWASVHEQETAIAEKSGEYDTSVTNSTVTERPSGLPCSNTIEESTGICWDDEDGG